MPRRIKPRLGWRRPSVRLGVPDEQIKSIYSPTFLAHAANEFEIPDGIQVRFGDAVIRAGVFYRQSKPVADDAPTLRQVIEHFEGMERHARDLLEHLENMDDASWSFFWRAEQDLLDDCISGRSSAMQEVGALRQVDPSEDAWEFYTRDDAPPVLGLLRLISDRAKAAIPPPSRGPKRQVALRRWAATVLDFWTGELGRPVTIDYQAGQASSETYRFLEWLLEPLDPHAVRHLATVLREERTRRRSGN